MLAGGYFFFFVIKAPKLTSTDSTRQRKREITLCPSTYLDMDPISVGLAPSGAKCEYLRITLTIKLNSDKEIIVLMNSMPMIKDSLFTFLRSLRATDFNSSSSTIELTKELIRLQHLL